MMRRRISGLLVVAVLIGLFCTTQTSIAQTRVDSITENRLTLPSSDQVWRVVLMRDFNTRVVVLGVMCLGLAAGIVGTFLLLRKRALTADALSHATLPGIAIAFMVMTALGGDGKSLPGLLTGAFISGMIGVGFIVMIRRTTRLKDDAALGIVLSVFFGLGTALMSVVQKMETGSAAGLNHFIFGKAASMLPSDAIAILVAAISVSVVCALLFKELRLLCFDAGYAESRGWSVVGLDLLLMGMVAFVTVIGLQAVGLVLVVALLIVPAAAARFWTDQLLPMTIASGLIGALSGYFGAVTSGLLPRMPTGPIIVVVCGLCFVISMVCGSRRGILVRTFQHWSLSRRVGLQHLLRSMYEASERMGHDPIGSGPVTTRSLLKGRSWSQPALARLVGMARRAHLVRDTPTPGTIQLTTEGLEEAARVVRNHRLWETYLIEFADIAPSHVDRDADMVEHILKPDLIRELEARMASHFPDQQVPPSPHVILAQGNEGAGS